MSPGRVSTWRRGARVALVLLTPALLAACANQQAMERAVAAQSLLVGMPETTLLSCAGVPPRTTTADDAEYLTSVRRGRHSPSAPSVGVGLRAGRRTGPSVA